jgi:aminoglycoside phosphotransferase (APT) family kinase protein
MTSSRRLDWRFLLPHPPGGFDHLVLLGGNATLAALAAELGVARRVSLSLAVADRADLVAVLGGRWEDPHRVAAALMPGGVWYWEIDRRSAPRAPAATARRLATAGLMTSAMYWIRGGFAHPRMFLPLDRDAALAWYFENIFRTPSGWRRVLRAGLRILTRWQGPRLGRLVRRYALVGAGGQPPSVLGVAGTAVGDDPRPLVVLGGEGDWSRVTLVPFAAQRDTPRTVVKVARRPAFSGRTAHEQSLLGQLRACAPAWLQESIPQALGFHEWHGHGVGVESCAAGKPLHSEALKGGAGAVQRLSEAAAWLTAFHQTTQRTRLHGEALQERIVRAPLAGYETAFGLERDEALLFARARSHAEGIAGADLPIAVQHGDFGPWNVFRNGGKVTVVDWEAAHEGPGLCDLLYFVMHWEAASRPHTMTHRVRRLALPLSLPRTDPLAEAARCELLRYMGRLGIAERLHPHVVLYTLVEQALERAARLREQGDPRATDRASNPYVSRVVALARDANGLFPEAS